MIATDPRAVLRNWLVTRDSPKPVDAIEADAVAGAAVEQGVAGLLFRTLVEERAGWPEAALARLESAHHRTLATGIRLLDLADRVTGFLAARGVRTLPLKGAAVVEALYHSPAERAMSDVDLLVLDEWREARRLVEAAGFTPVDKADHAWPFSEATTGLVVELHRSIATCGRLFPLDREGLWNRSRPAEGRSVRFPSPEDTLVHLSLHSAFQHGLVLTLGQHLDLRRLIERQPLQIEVVRRIAGEQRTEAVVALAIAASRIAIGGTPVEIDEAFTDRLSRPLRHHLETARRNPLLLVTPALPSLVRLRWALARGRRADWIRATLSPREGQAGDARGSLLQAGARAWTLVRRWTLASAWRRE